MCSGRKGERAGAENQRADNGGKGNGSHGRTPDVRGDALCGSVPPASLGEARACGTLADFAVGKTAPEKEKAGAGPAFLLTPAGAGQHQLR
jgi:hypothetical protein